ncbi:hypothetical protein [Sphingomonas sp. PAMC 26605]|uniref:hypothetical protein n=1 Tax=Sphingomonas sp. PAMC 26605 TaxID=1112214 RepID=UPI00026CA7B6|nr:hypothetical protein [Sphingomonas sp. PAMC 26605]
MATDIRKATLVAARDLPKIVEAAVHAAGDRVGVSGQLVLRWDLAGKVVRDLLEGQKFADNVALHMKAAGVDAAPAVLAIDNHIIAGFFERQAVPQIRTL